MKYVSFIVLRLSLSCEVKADGDFIYTGSMNTIRYNHMATLLPDGKVLVTGGRNNNSSSVWASAELYDPAAGTWATTSSRPRNFFSVKAANIRLRVGAWVPC